MKHPWKAACTNTDEQPSVFCELDEVKLWVFHPLDKVC
mgnify:FL=1